MIKAGNMYMREEGDGKHVTLLIVNVCKKYPNTNGLKTLMQRVQFLYLANNEISLCYDNLSDKYLIFHKWVKVC